MLTASFYALWSLLALLRNCPLISQFTNSPLDCHVTACRQKTCGSYSNISSPIFKPVCAAFNYWAFYLIIFIYSTHHKLSFFYNTPLSLFSFFFVTPKRITRLCFHETSPYCCHLNRVTHATCSGSTWSRAGRSRLSNWLCKLCTMSLL